MLTPSGSIDDGNDGNNYVVNFATVDSGAITPLAVTVTADALSKPFGAVEPALTFLGAQFSIDKADQTITVTKTAPLKAYVGSSFNVAASSSSGLPVTFSASGACSNTGAIFTITKTGTCFVQFDQPGNDSYKPAPQVVRTVNQEGMPVFYQFFPLTHR